MFISRKRLRDLEGRLQTLERQQQLIDQDVAALCRRVGMSRLELALMHVVNVARAEGMIDPPIREQAL